MLIVFNKDKIISYFISFSTVAILLGMAFFIKSKSGLLEVANTEKKLPIYSVKTTDKQVALTMNCAWSQ